MNNSKKSTKMNKTVHIILDYGHGCNCPGKCSPDKSFYEWKFTRDVGKEIAKRLLAMGYTVHETWTQDHEPTTDPKKTCTKKQLDNALNYRWKEVNRLCSQFGASNCVSVSIHANAAGGDGKWHDATGFCVMVGRKASINSKKLARKIYDAADRRGLRGNRCVPPERFWTQGLAMCDCTNCPAVLTESLFYDNKSDLAILKSAEGKAKIVDLHVDAITKYVESL